MKTERIRKLITEQLDTPKSRTRAKKIMTDEKKSKIKKMIGAESIIMASKHPGGGLMIICDMSPEDAVNAFIAITESLSYGLEKKIKQLKKL